MYVWQNYIYYRTAKPHNIKYIQIPMRSRWITLSKQHISVFDFHANTHTTPAQTVWKCGYTILETQHALQTKISMFKLIQIQFM